MQKPNGATHISEYGTYYKLVGSFWYVYHDGSWFAVSGTPAYPLTQLKNDSSTS